MFPNDKTHERAQRPAALHGNAIAGLDAAGWFGKPWLIMQITRQQSPLTGPDYFEVHAVAQDPTRSSTSRCVFVRPAATSARPRRTAAMMRSSSAISSRDAFSGSLWRASSTACLSVIEEEYSFPLSAASCYTARASNGAPGTRLRNHRMAQTGVASSKGLSGTRRTLFKTC